MEAFFRDISWPLTWLTSPHGLLSSFSSSPVGYLFLSELPMWKRFKDVSWPLHLANFYTFPFVKLSSSLVGYLVLSALKCERGSETFHTSVGGILPSFFFFALASWLFNLKLLILELRFWLVKRSFFLGLFNSSTLCFYGFRHLIRFCFAQFSTARFKGKRWFRFAKTIFFVCISLFRQPSGPEVSCHIWSY